MNEIIEQHAKEEGKRLADYLSTHPESALNPVFLADVLSEFGDFVRAVIAREKK